MLDDVPAVLTPARRRWSGWRIERTLSWLSCHRRLGAWAISCALLLGGVVLVGDPTRTAALLAWLGRLTFVLLVWPIWPVSYTLWPSRPKAGEAPTALDSEEPEAGGRSETTS